jgi:zinc protease
LPGQFETAMETSSLIGELYTYNLPDNYYALLPAKFEALTPSAVEDAAKTDVHANQMVVVAVGDKAKIQSGLEKLNIGPIVFRSPTGEPVTAVTGNAAGGQR